MAKVRTSERARWVFGYASLMWAPDFPSPELRPGILEGHRRALCLLSHRRWGTEQTPGLVMGLMRGERCQGMLVRIPDAEHNGIVRTLDEREGPAYERVVEDVTDADGTVHRAYVYTTDPGHPHFIGELDPDRAAEHVLSAAGIAGPCSDYVLSTVETLRAHGVHEPALFEVAARIRDKIAVCST